MHIHKPNLLHQQYQIAIYIAKWLLYCTLIGGMAGTASAFFLVSLDWVTQWRESHTWVIALLPLGGLLIGLLYHYQGRAIEAGNNLLIDQIHKPTVGILFRMAPFVLLGTLVTHLFGGSAGREGTAVQMGGALSDQLTRIFKFKPHERRLVLIAGVSAGFAAVFGTPLAGMFFGLEFFRMGRIRYEALLPSFLAAVIAHYVTTSWGVGHTHYSIPDVPYITPLTILLTLLAGICFGLLALAFTKTTHWMGTQFKTYVNYPPLRPAIGGIIIASGVWLMGTQYIGLGIPTITDAFVQPQAPYHFVGKLIFTAVTLGAGFKGGEVTPLFFMGATLGNSLSYLIPLPVALLAGMGFVAVFAGAANTPIACTLMAMELFGAPCGVYAGLACTVAYLFSGHTGIYGSQVIGSPKHLLWGEDKGRALSSLNNKSYPNK